MPSSWRSFVPTDQVVITAAVAYKGKSHKLVIAVQEIFYTNLVLVNQPLALTLTPTQLTNPKLPCDLRATSFTPTLTLIITLTLTPTLLSNTKTSSNPKPSPQDAALPPAPMASWQGRSPSVHNPSHNQMWCNNQPNS